MKTDHQPVSVIRRRANSMRHWLDGHSSSVRGYTKEFIDRNRALITSNSEEWAKGVRACPECKSEAQPVLKGHLDGAPIYGCSSCGYNYHQKG